MENPFTSDEPSYIDSLTSIHLHGEIQLFTHTIIFADGYNTDYMSER